VHLVRSSLRRRHRFDIATTIIFLRLSPPADVSSHGRPSRIAHATRATTWISPSPPQRTPQGKSSVCRSAPPPGLGTTTTALAFPWAAVRNPTERRRLLPFTTMSFAGCPSSSRHVRRHCFFRTPQRYVPGCCDIVTVVSTRLCLGTDVRFSQRFQWHGIIVPLILDSLCDWLI